MQSLPLSRYRRLRSWLPFDRLADKFYGVLVLASMTPLLVMIGFLLFAPQNWQPERLLGWTTAATLLALGLSIWLTHALLAPVTLARLALHAYRREQRLLPLPLDLDGEAGGLLNDLRATMETCERQRQIFAEQADWAFREKSSPLLDGQGAPRRRTGGATTAPLF
ncbi:hypothetical protein [Solimonas terrae]|uniref:Uncharacterized protein n=1 Tax=Solimonas terrae TaxID=1396819 RepID=A0A6M2BTV5_9GAMM|nr:hypothetical protein [Solimonas terrae]NGY05665.1 hypothetical protein [Solimonas terrae]